MGSTDPVERALQLRKTLVDSNGDVLVADFSGTLQGKDTSRVIDLMPIIHSGRNTGIYPFRAKVNVKEIDPFAATEYGKTYFDMSKHSDAEIEEVIRKSEFDFPLWFKYDSGFEMKRAGDFNLPFIMQVAGCNFSDGSQTGGCYYCFVDNVSNNGIPGEGKTYLNSVDAVDSMMAAREKIHAQYAPEGIDMNIRVLRTSGGEPTLALDWILNTWREVDRRGLDYVGQIDSNLSTGQVVTRFEQEGIYEPNTLDKLAEFPVKVLTALKGITNENIHGNVQSTATIEQQKYSIKRFVDAGFQIFPQMYNPDPAALRGYLEMMDSEIENFSMRVHVGPLKAYGPTKQRLEGVVSEGLPLPCGEVPFGEVVGAQVAQWDSNYRESMEVMDKYLRETKGVGYKEVTRSDVPVRVIK